MSDIAPPPSSARAGFWRRAIAFAIDVCLISLVVSVIGAISFRLTDGKLRLSSGLLDISLCSKIDPQKIGLEIPPQFKVSSADDCTKSFLGLEHDRFVKITETTESGSLVYNRSLSYPLDMAGRPTNVLYLDFIWLILLPAYVLFFEWRLARTIGKRLMHLRIRSLDGGAIDFVQALKRLVIRFLPWPFWSLVYTSPVQKSMSLFVLVVGFFGISTLTIGVNFILATRHRLLPWDDRWARTEVVRE